MTVLSLQAPVALRDGDGIITCDKASSELRSGNLDEAEAASGPLPSGPEPIPLGLAPQLGGNSGPKDHLLVDQTTCMSLSQRDSPVTMTLESN